jgi:hypothetical protein
VVDQERTWALGADDRALVDLLTAVLVDPNVHTDLRMRLHREVSAILRAAREDLDRAAADGHGVEPENKPLPDLLTAVLVDPDLHTDLRMRLHREIRTVLSRVHETNPV